MYSIVEFETNEIEVCPNNWILNEDECVWPPYKDAHKTSKAIFFRESPDLGWPQYTLEKIHKTDSEYTLFWLYILIPM